MYKRKQKKNCGCRFGCIAEEASADVFDEDWEESLETEVFCEKMVSMSSKSLWNDDDEWIPYRLRWLTKQRKAKKGTFSHLNVK